MKRYSVVGTAVLSLLICVISPLYAQEDADLETYLSLNSDLSVSESNELEKAYALLLVDNSSPNKAVDEQIAAVEASILNLLADSTDNALEVEATAYTSHVAQTDRTPNIAAWGDRLRPGVKAIAVSRDLLMEYGLKHRTKVRIEGLAGEFLVLDKMNKRWSKKIDIYMGMNRKAAFKWGKRKVLLLWG